MKTTLLALAACLAWLPCAHAQTTENNALHCSGTNDYLAAPAPLAVADDFTMELWVRPTAPHEIDGVSAGELLAGTSGQHYAVYPLHGTACWGPGHAGVGVSVGTNGVTVYEHAADYMPAVLVYEGALSGWTHVAVVYVDRRPMLYINSKLVRMGQPSNASFVHPSAGRPVDRFVYGGIGGGPFGYFAGMIDDVRIWDRVRTPTQIRSTMAESSVRDRQGLVLNYDMNRTGAGAGLSLASVVAPLLNGRTFGTATTPLFVPFGAGTTETVAVPALR